MNKEIWWFGVLSSLGLTLQPTIAQANPTLNLPPAPAQTQAIAPAAGRPIQTEPRRTPADPEEAMSQVQSVDELSDVLPSDWAYQAVKALVEKYGVISGYANSTFQGDRPLTRYEFAVAVRQVISQVEQQLNRGDLIQAREDFAILRRAIEIDNAIAADLQKRLAQLDDRIGKQTQEQFSVTSKLTGQTVGVITDGSNANPTILSRTRLTVQTSFGPNTLLVTQLEAGNNGNDAIGKAHDRRQNLLGTQGLLAGGGGADYVGFGSSLRISKLYYSFQPAKDLSLTIGSKLAPRDFIDYNRYANDSATNFSSSFFANNPLIVQNAIDRPGGAGAVLVWKPSRLPLTLRALYVAADADRPNPGSHRRRTVWRSQSGQFGTGISRPQELDRPVAVHPSNRQQHRYFGRRHQRRSADQSPVWNLRAVRFRPLQRL